jgi:curved DNA-binding protein CbpA
MFVDYYALFEISETSTEEQIKIAFKKQALKWHPDKNPGNDTTEKMQMLLEAKLILLDKEARHKYNAQYRRFKQAEEVKKQKIFKNDFNSKSEKKSEHKYTFTDFDIDDDVLKRWINNAKKQAVDLAKKTIEELKGMTKAGIKEGTKEMGNALLYQIIFSLIIILIIGTSRACN